MTVSDVGPLTVTLAAGVEPNMTVDVGVKFSPEITTDVPPAVGPLDGVTLLTTGGGSLENPAMAPDHFLAGVVSCHVAAILVVLGST